jgi:fructose-1,6-bisphosphatase
MTQDKCHFMVISILYEGLEKFLNDVEELPSGQYSIVSIIPLDRSSRTEKRMVVGVVIRFTITEDDDIEFDEDIIRRRLGFDME